MGKDEIVEGVAYQERQRNREESSWGHILGCRSGMTLELFRFYLKYNRENTKVSSWEKRYLICIIVRWCWFFSWRVGQEGLQKKQEEELGSCYQKLGRDDGGIRIIGIAWRMGGANP